MTITIQEQADGIKALFEGRLDTPAAIKAQQDMAPLMENADKIITLDCTKLEYISSSGLRLFLALHHEGGHGGFVQTVAIVGVRAYEFDKLTAQRYGLAHQPFSGSVAVVHLYAMCFQQSAHVALATADAARDGRADNPLCHCSSSR